MMAYISGMLSFEWYIGHRECNVVLLFTFSCIYAGLFAVALGDMYGLAKILPTGVGQKCHQGDCIYIVPILVPSQFVNFYAGTAGPSSVGKCQGTP